MPLPLSAAGLRLLDRRTFLGSAGTGLGGVALAALLAEGGQLRAADGGPIRPVIRPEAPLAPRPPHFPAKAKRVVHVFCTGAVSHLDTWDYKPKLVELHGKPLPGADKLVTFQGENGNVARSPWTFRPSGQSGKYV